MDSLLQYEVNQLIENSLSEDLFSGDATTDILFNNAVHGKASILAKSDGVLCGSDVVSKVFERIDSRLKIEWFLHDGDSFVGKDKVSVAEISGSIASILKGERTAINFLQHLSGISTQTKVYVDAISAYKTQILDTRKTIPGLRNLQKYAVKIGGGKNHRKNLSDGILIKDNHINIASKHGYGFDSIISKMKKNAPKDLKVEIEVSNIEEVVRALESDADIIMLDNMSSEEMKVAVEIIDSKALTEASGGINLDNIVSVAQTGVDFISIGALTHSVSAIDFSLEMI